MDSASCSILRAQPFSSATAVFPPSNNTTTRFFALPKSNRSPNLVPPFSSTFPRNSNFPGKCLHFDRFSAVSSFSNAQDQNPSRELAVLLEVNGVLMDAYRLGNRQTFNATFKKLGLDCASWPEPVYLDLLRMSAGDEEKMVNLYFNRIGWPSSLPTSEKASFVKNVLQKKLIILYLPSRTFSKAVKAVVFEAVIVENRGLGLIVGVVKTGLRLEARQHAAGTLFYLLQKLDSIRRISVQSTFAFVGQKRKEKKTRQKVLHMDSKVVSFP